MIVWTIDAVAGTCDDGDKARNPEPLLDSREGYFSFRR
jgi:hypothetical protein